MTINDTTKVTGVSVTATGKVFAATGQGRIGARITASAANAVGTLLLVSTVPAGQGAPTITVDTAMFALSPGQTLNGGNDLGGGVDIYWSNSGTVKGSAWELGA